MIRFTRFERPYGQYVPRPDDETGTAGPRRQGPSLSVASSEQAFSAREIRVGVHRCPGAPKFPQGSSPARYRAGLSQSAASLAAFLVGPDSCNPKFVGRHRSRGLSPREEPGWLARASMGASNDRQLRRGLVKKSENEHIQEYDDDERNAHQPEYETAQHSSAPFAKLLPLTAHRQHGSSQRPMAGRQSADPGAVLVR